jgi:hypothetical protein
MFATEIFGPFTCVFIGLRSVDLHMGSGGQFVHKGRAANVHDHSRKEQMFYEVLFLFFRAMLGVGRSI